MDLKVGQLVELLNGAEFRVMEVRKSEVLLCTYDYTPWFRGVESKDWDISLALVSRKEVLRVLEDVEGLDEDEDYENTKFNIEPEGLPTHRVVGSFLLGEKVRVEGLFEGASIDVEGYLIKREGDDDKDRKLDKEKIMGSDKVVITEVGSRASGRYYVALGECLKKVCP